ncbi:arylsulfatase [Oscillatoria salina]|uniref:arylsulfatase n=1 Tax=Oscillatoria salina TaxID=331517 RepID=UPI0013B87204|nr:arylsulfatase [Oscillatoria salina]MBZ8182528.1 arylsulfatase [Oscillatoria salina IIICB1]NET91156.1 arylsulfatase [Kamptonema sp. SIO1D9]
MSRKISPFVLVAGVASRKISRFFFLASFTTFTVLGFSSVREGAEAQERRGSGSDRPNIIMIVGDDMGYSDLGAYGSEIPTPNLDDLAKQGMMFTNFHTAPACSPTRSMLLTGVNNHLAGLGTMDHRIAPSQKDKPGYEGYLNDRVVSVATLLRDAGYNTYMTGKWHLGESEGHRPHERGFEKTFVMLEGGGNHYNTYGFSGHKPINTYMKNGQNLEKLPEGFYSTKTYTDEMINFIESDRQDGKPFFAYLAYTAPHAPFQAPQEYIEKYMGKYDAGWDVIRAQRFENQKELNLIPEYLELPPRWPMVDPWNSLSAEERRIQAKKMAIYAAMIDYMDETVGRFLDYLKETGEYDNSIIIFFSDNGGSDHDKAEEVKDWLEEIGFDNSYENMGNGDSFVSFGHEWAQVITTPHWAAKSTQAEGGVRGAFFMAFPGVIQPGSRSDAFTSVLDMTPTLLEYAGVRHPGTTYNGRTIHGMEGKSMRPILEGWAQRIYGENEPIAFELYGTVNKALYMGDWKILKLGDRPWGRGNNESWKLFNLRSDPRELVDLSQEYPLLLQRMVSYYNQYEQSVGFVPALTE